MIAVCLIPIVGLIAGCEKRGGQQPNIVRINAAASIAPVIEAVSGDIENALGLTIEVNAGGSGVLAQQIARGDRVDLFISADTFWMDDLEQRGLIDPTTRVNLAGNRLVLIGPKDTGVHPERIGDLADKQYQPIAVGDPAYVPAGRYAAQALESHGLGNDDTIRLAEAPNVRAAVAFVLAGQCPVGIVYGSNVVGSDEVRVLLEIDPADHDPIRYPAAALKDAPNREPALRVLAWLQSERARAAFKSAGFSGLEPVGDGRFAP